MRPSMTRAHLIWKLNIYQIRKNDFLHLGFTAIHQPHPFHWIRCFQHLSDSLGLCHLLDDGINLFLGLLVNIGEVAVQLAAQQQGVIQNWAVFFEILLVPLTPHADRLFFFSGYSQTGEIVVANEFIP